MKTRSIIMVFTLILAGGFAAHAQDLGASSIKLILNGQTYGGTLTTNNPGPAEYTWTLPNASGTLALESAGTGWTTIGNNLGSTGLLGSLNPFDVNLIANNQTRMTLLNGAAAVLLPSSTELRFGDDDNSHYTALKAPAAQASSWQIVLPDYLPGGNDVRLKVQDVSGNVVKLGYTEPGLTASIGFNALSQTTTTNAGPVDVTGVFYTVGPSSVYSFECVIEISRPAASNAKPEISWVLPAIGITDLQYYMIALSDPNGGIKAGFTEATNTSLDFVGGNPKKYILKGYIKTDADVLDDTIVQMQMTSSNGNTVSITSESSVQLISE